MQFLHLTFRSSPSDPPLFANEVGNKSVAFLSRRRSLQNSSATNLHFQDLWDLLTCDLSWLFLPLPPGLLLISNSASLLSVPSEDPQPPCLFLFSPFASTSSSLETHPSYNA